MARIAFDVHGTLNRDSDGLLMKILNGCLENGDEVFIISGPPDKQVKEEISALGINPTEVTIISVVDWLKEQKTYMWQDDKGDWWCDDYNWWSSKGLICVEYKIDMIFDDKFQYLKHMPETTRFVLWEGTPDVSYYGLGGKSEEIMVCKNCGANMKNTQSTSFGTGEPIYQCEECNYTALYKPEGVSE